MPKLSVPNRSRVTSKRRVEILLQHYAVGITKKLVLAVGTNKSLANLPLGFEFIPANWEHGDIWQEEQAGERFWSDTSKLED